MTELTIDKDKISFTKNKKIEIQELNIKSLTKNNNKSNNLVFINSSVIQHKEENLNFKLNFDKLNI